MITINNKTSTVYSEREFKLRDMFCKEFSNILKLSWGLVSYNYMLNYLNGNLCNIYIIYYLYVELFK